ncbi:hypothetical protein JTB14_019080 [Gonioctena quinquepunctata]|nr:hypothetical protein JTB14_019080 [Gonioctena quinquepunctata]
MQCITVFILIIAVFISVNAKEIPEKYKKFRDECHTAVDAITPRVLCMHIKFGIQNLHGDINKQAIKKSLEDTTDLGGDVIDEIVSDCGGTRGDTASEAANKLNDCMKERLRHFGVL